MTHALHATQGKIDEGEPAPRHILSVAPDHMRCTRIIKRKDGTTGPCSRFGITLPDGTRDTFCISHSSSRRAARSRSKGARERRTLEQADRRHREWVMNQVAPEPFQIPDDIRLARHVLRRLLVLGELTPSEVRELRALIDSDEAMMLRAPGEYHT